MSNGPSEFYQSKRYEDHAYVLDFIPRAKSAVIKEIEGPLLQAIGQDRLSILEILASQGVVFETGEKISIGKENRSKIVSVLGKLDYSDLTSEARNELESVLKIMIIDNQARYIYYFNELQAITPRLHGLELIPGIGKKFMKQIVSQRERKRFENFEDLSQRVAIRDPAQLVAKRIVEELSGGSRVFIFVGH